MTEHSSTPRRPHLHVVIYSPFPCYSGGRENWLFNILTQFSKREIPVTVYSYKSNRDRYYDLHGLQWVELIHVPSIRYWHELFLAANLAALRMLFLLDGLVLFPRIVARFLTQKVREGDIILTMNPVVDIRPALYLRRQGHLFELFCSVRGLFASEVSSKMPWLKSLLYRLESDSLAKADHILANGYDTKTYLQSIGFASEVIPNGVDVERFTNPDMDDPALDRIQAWRTAGYKVIAMVATLRKINGVQELLHAAAILKSIDGLPFRVMFVGKGDANTYRRLASRLNLEDEVAFVGEQKNVPGFLHCADVVACLASGGGMSMSFLEAMAAGRAVVAWDTTQYAQLLRDGETGRLVPHQDTEALARALMETIESPQTAARMGVAARRVAAHYDWQIVADRLESALYKSCGVTP